jgi:hypothetical protein
VLLEAVVEEQILLLNVPELLVRGLLIEQEQL